MADIEWITLNATAGTGDSAVTWSVPAWTGSGDRSVRLTVAVPGTMLSDTVTVTQRGSGDTGPVDGDFYIIIRELSDSGTDGIVYATNDNTPRAAFEYSVDGGEWQSIAEGGQLSITSALINTPIYLRFLTEMGHLRFENIEDVEVGGSTSSADRRGDGWAVYTPIGNDSLDTEMYKCIKKADNLLLDSEICNRALSYSSISVPPAFPNKAVFPQSILYDSLFQGCASLLDGPVFPTATTYDFSAQNCFRDCTSLTGAPVLPAEVAGGISGIGCQSMFWNCSSLKTAPAIPSLVATESTFPYVVMLSDMFRNCTALTDGSVFPDEVDGQLTTSRMYYSCTSLVRVPPLPNKVSTFFDAGAMFRGCTSLTNGPSLPSVIGKSAYIGRMYYGCSSLTSASINFPLSLINKDDYGEVFIGVAPTGILKVRSDETMSDDDIRTKVALPSGWTIQRVL